MMRRTRMVATIAVGLLLATAMAVGGCWVERRVHYKFGYERMVQQTVREMVRAEALKERAPATAEEPTE